MYDSTHVRVSGRLKGVLRRLSLVLSLERDRPITIDDVIEESVSAYLAQNPQLQPAVSEHAAVSQ